MNQSIRAFLSARAAFEDARAKLPRGTTRPAELAEAFERARTNLNNAASGVPRSQQARVKS